MPRLTKRVIEAAEIKAAEHFIWDDSLPGFGVRVLPSGRKGYIVQYRAGRRSRRMSLGPSTVLTCEQARTRAITIIAAARGGDDPAARRDADRRTATVKELADRFDKEHVSLRIKESTAKGYRRLLQLTILPALGRHRVTEVTGFEDWGQGRPPRPACDRCVGENRPGGEERLGDRRHPPGRPADRPSALLAAGQGARVLE